MYRFTDTVDRHTDYGLTVQTVYNGLNLEDLLSDEKGNFLTLSVFGRSDIANRVETYQVPGLDGLLEYEELTLGEREIVVSYKIKDETSTGLRKRIERLNSLLSSSKKQLTFTDESDVFYYATLLKNELPEEIGNDTVGTLTFMCSDPFKYGTQKEVTQTSDVLTINNAGSVKTYPVIDVEINKPTTFVAVGNGHDINMIGEPLDVDNFAFEPRTILLNDSMGSTVGWGPAGFQPEGSIKAGEITSNGEALLPSNYGTAGGWHGPAVQKSLSESLQDFGVEFTFRFSTAHPSEIGKIQLYGLDAGNKKIFRMGMTDYWSGKSLNMPEGSLYNLQERRKDVLVRNAPDDWGNFYGYMRVTRNGRDIEFFLKMVDQKTGKTVATKTRRWFDTAEEYQQPLSSVGVHFAQYGTYKPVDTIYASHVSVWRINKDTGIPYIANPGDIITFDHPNDLILLNGEDVTGKKAFIGNYYPLYPGENVLTVEPFDSISNVSVRWRDRWL